ncbi:MAG: CHAT domain-containing protein [Deltaproteobacteria bacterium]|nr:CHAT domain-containing protein [Deltaproteobacteria bacterium]
MRIGFLLPSSYLILGLGMLVAMVGACSPGEGEEDKEHLESFGVIVERVGVESAIELAGIEPGDLLLSWEAVDAHGAHPRLTSGRFETFGDWISLELEQAPRGEILIHGKRAGESRTFRLKPLLWDTVVRPVFSFSPGPIRYSKPGPPSLEERQRVEEAHREIVFQARRQKNRSLEWWSHLRSARRCAWFGWWPCVEASFDAALESASDEGERGKIWRRRGFSEELRGQFALAQQFHEKAAELWAEAWGEGSLHFAACQAERGRMAWRQGDLETAQEAHHRALKLWRELAPASEALAWSVTSLGLLAQDKGNYEEAEQLLGEAVELFPSGSSNQGVAFNNIGNLIGRLGRLDEAEIFLLQALAVFEPLDGQEVQRAKSLSGLGSVALLKGQLGLAQKRLEQASRLYRQGGRTPDLAASLQDLAEIAADRGELDKAQDFLEQALALEEDSALGRESDADILHQLGTLAWKRGSLQEAEQYFEKSLAIHSAAPQSPLQKARALLGKSRVARAGEPTKVVTLLEEALEICQQAAPRGEDMIVLLNELGEVELGRGRFDEAVSSLLRAEAILLETAPRGLLMAETLQHLGEASRRLGNLEPAEEYLQRSLDIRSRISAETALEAETLQSLARLRRDRGQVAIAAKVYERAVQALEGQISKVGSSRELRASLRSQRGPYREYIETLLALGREEEAFSVLERSRAGSFLELLAERDLIFALDVPGDLERERREITVLYDRTQNEIWSLPVESSPSRQRELEERLSSLRRRHEANIEKIRGASARLAALKYPRPLDLSAAREALDGGTVVLSFSVGEEVSDLFVVSRERGLSVVPLEVGEEELRSKVTLFLERIRNPPWRSDDLGVSTLARELYDDLLAGAEPEIERAERLLILPDSALHHLPFAALQRPAAGPSKEGAPGVRYLVQWKPFVEVLSVTAFAELRRSRGDLDGTLESPPSLAAFGDPFFSRGAMDGVETMAEPRLRSALRRGFQWAPLPSTREEVEQIAEFYGDSSKVFLGEQASEEEAKSLPLGTRRIHFATHGLLDERFPLDSGLLLAVPEEFEEGKENGLLQAWEIFESLRLDADLVVLSACDSALGKEQRGEGLIGLTRAFHYAGARTVAASLWQVADHATAELMVKFHRHLRGGKSKDEALRAAQVELMERPIYGTGEEGGRGELDVSAPYFWAAFQVYGDWQ